MRFWLFLLVGLGCAWLLSSCDPLPEEGQLRFKTIELKYDSAYIGQEQYTALDPGIIVISSVDDLEKYGSLFSESARKVLREMNFGNQIAIAVFQGWKFTLGYGVEITSVSRDGSNIQIKADFEELETGQDVNGRVSSPYHLVEVWKLGVWSEALHYELIVDGTVLAEFPTTIR